jgi:hypothetical protein
MLIGLEDWYPLCTKEALRGSSCVKMEDWATATQAPEEGVRGEAQLRQSRGEGLVQEAQAEEQKVEVGRSEFVATMRKRIMA